MKMWRACLSRLSRAQPALWLPLPPPGLTGLTLVLHLKKQSMKSKL
jgi:hypothetical protein